jgi:hypothetical protein
VSIPSSCGPPSGTKTKAAAKFFSLPLGVSLSVDVYGVAEGVGEGSTLGLGVGVPNGGVGVGETSVPGVEVGSAESERCGL